MNHARADRLSGHVLETYWWPTLKSDVTKWLDECHHCALARARHVWKHTMYSTMKVVKPHMAYGIDFWDPTLAGALTSAELETLDYRYILTVIDLFHSYTRLYAVRTKSAAEAMVVLYNQIFMHQGYQSSFCRMEIRHFAVK